ncbi:MAG: alpha/beta fold hydrolase [Tumebacillaceae bacterium]
MKLFCLPNAGGSAHTAYQPWKKHLSSNITLIPVELTGRGSRIIEPLAETLEAMMADLYEQVRPELDGTPYAIYGHSMGSLLAYELGHLLIEKGHNAPVALFVSGKKPPHHPVVRVGYNLPREDLKQMIEEFGGTATEILADDDLFEMFEPMIRADLTITDTYVYRAKNRLFECPIEVFNGLSDVVTTVEHMKEWREYTTGSCTIQHYEGGHFFLNDYVESICARIAKYA